MDKIDFILLFRVSPQEWFKQTLSYRHFTPNQLIAELEDQITEDGSRKIKRS